MLDREDVATGSGDALPPLWHWFYFLGTAPQSHLSSDGHPQRGGFMPPIELPRRMFAGARTRFHRPLSLGQPAERHAEILNITLKTGRTGQLAFVTVAYRFVQDGATLHRGTAGHRVPRARRPGAGAGAGADTCA